MPLTLPVLAYCSSLGLQCSPALQLVSVSWLYEGPTAIIHRRVLNLDQSLSTECDL